MSDFFVGKIIKDLKIADDKLALLFICEDGEHVVRVDADCCSSTWIESVELPALGFPAMVAEVNDLNMPDDGSEEARNGELSFYGCQIKTDKGEIVIDYRNASNGYYGGSIVFPDDYFYGGVHDKNVSSNNWVEIKG